MTVNSSFSVVWEGPGGKNDFVTICSKDAPENAYGDYFYVEGTSGDGQLSAPSTSGDYEVRYVTEENVVLARQAVRVE